MQLKSQQAVGSTRLLVIVRQFRGFNVIDVMREMEALGGYAIGIPFAFLDCLANFLGVTEFHRLLL